MNKAQIITNSQVQEQTNKVRKLLDMLKHLIKMVTELSTSVNKLHDELVISRTATTFSLTVTDASNILLTCAKNVDHKYTNKLNATELKSNKRLINHKQAFTSNINLNNAAYLHREVVSHTKRLEDHIALRNENNNS